MRSLFLTVHLLEKEGIDAKAEVVAHRVRVRLGGRTADFSVDELERAVNWLVREVKRRYPSCALARVWAITEKASKV